jgi:hypothetical protein
VEKVRPSPSLSFTREYIEKLKNCGREKVCSGRIVAVVE